MYVNLLGTEFPRLIHDLNSQFFNNSSKNLCRDICSSM